MAWNSRGLPLHSVVLPPFLYGRGVHDNWVINEALTSDFRFVFDASLTISSFYLDDQPLKSYSDIQGSGGSMYENRSWEYNGNFNLGMVYGSLFYKRSNDSDLVKLWECDGQYTFVETTENVFHPLGHDDGTPSLRKVRMLRSWRKKKTNACLDVLKNSSKILDCSLMDQTTPSELDFPFSLESLLSLRADENKTIVLAVAGYSYKDMLMSWACRLRHLQITNFIVSALDEETYQFSILQVLISPSALHKRSIIYMDL